MGPMDRRRWGAGSAGALASLSAAVGLVVGMRSAVAFEAPVLRLLLQLPAIPVETLGISWSPDALWPRDLQAAALDRVAGLLAALFLAALAVALLNALVLLVEGGMARWRETTVRAALGAGPWTLARGLLGDVRRLLAGGTVLGVLLGMTAGGALRTAWPGPPADPEIVAGAGLLLPVLLLLTGMAGLAYAAVGLLTLRRGSLAPALSAGDRATADRGAVFLRRSLSAAQAGAAGAVVLGASALTFGVAPVGPAGSGTLRVIPVEAPDGARDGHWGTVLARIDALPGVEAESLATPGALLGLGVRDHALAQCGACYRGGLPLFFWGAEADHHAVTPGFVDAAGLEVVAGRDLAPDDGPGAEPVVLVNETFAGRSFEDGDPLGRKVRLGGSLDDWYTVVGVVSDAEVTVLGGDNLARAVVYVSALQRPPSHGQLLLRGGEDAAEAARAFLAGEGYRPGDPHTLAAHRREAAAPLAWLRRVAFLLGALTLALALHGSYLTALQVTRRQTRELAVRRALGASDRRIVAHVLRGAGGVSAAATLVAVFFGALLVAVLRKAAAGVAPLGAEAYLAVAVLLLGSGVTAAWRAAREAASVPPARALAGRSPHDAEPRRAGTG